jgi:hypothetical protein
MALPRFCVLEHWLVSGKSARVVAAELGQTHLAMPQIYPTALAFPATPNKCRCPNDLAFKMAVNIARDVC